MSSPFKGELLFTMIIDTHAHLNFSDYDSDREEVLKRTVEENVGVINVGSNFNTSKIATDLIDENKNIYASVGLHPLHVKEGFDLDKYKSLIKKGVVAIGETGLDKEGSDFEMQKEVFYKHIELSRTKKLPLILHCRKDHKRLFDILNEFDDLKGVIHCFTGRKSDLKKYLSLGYYIGFNGIIMKLNLNEAIKDTPLGRMLIETDCPYLDPEGRGRNEPIMVKKIAKKIAEIKGIESEEVEETTTQNAKDLFGI